MLIEEWRLQSKADCWELVRPAGGAKRNLLEARFHVANAEVFAAATGDIHRAHAELDRAGDYLQNALPLVTGNMQSTINAIRNDVIHAKSALETEDTAAKSTDEQIKSELDGAIVALHRNRL
jgi:cellobiose-specific phosphotransferase system component IIA